MMTLTPQISDDILCLAEVDFLKQVAHLELHILDHLSNIGNVRSIVFDSHVGFYLTDHVSREVQTAERFAVCTEREDDGGSKLVVSGAGAVLGVEDMDTVPAARAASRWRNGWWRQ